MVGIDYVRAEHLVGQGIRDALSSSNTTPPLSRQDLWIQTKYTPISGQDPKNLPYDPGSSIADQVHTSVASSLQNLGCPPSSSSHSGGDNKEDAYLDCVLLHSPLPSLPQTMEAWTALSTYVPNRIRTLGISNVSLPVLAALYDAADIKPQVVQNRFHAATAYDVALRDFCLARGIRYQSFWTLTGNPALLRSGVVVGLARASGVLGEVVLYALVQALGVTVLNGTTTHMRSDLQGLEKLETWKGAGADNAAVWERHLKAFAHMVGET